MSGRKHMAIILAAVAAAALLASSVTGFLLSRHYSRIQYEMLDTISGQVLDREPEAEESLMAVLKEYADKDTGGKKRNQYLSEKRVEYVLDILRTKYNVSEDRLVVKAVGAESTFIEGQPELNRCVVLEYAE